MGKIIVMGLQLIISKIKSKFKMPSYLDFDLNVKSDQIDQK